MEPLRIQIREIEQDQTYLGKEIWIAGRVKTVRDAKEICFGQITDGSCLEGIQIVGQGEMAKALKQLGTGDVIEVRGRVEKSPAKGQSQEIHAQEIRLLGECEEGYPLQKKRHSFEYLRSVAHLRPRTNTFYCVFKLRSALSQALHRFFHEEGFVYVHTPLITGSDCEGAGETFRITTLDLDNPPKDAAGKVDDSRDFFGKRTQMTVSGQLNLEAYALAFGEVYCFGPAFRAENSNTQRHASEFWLCEPEMAYCDLQGNMQVAQKMLQYAIREVLSELPQEMAFLDRFVENGLIERLEKLAQADFQRMTYTEAIAWLQKSGRHFEYPVEWGCDLKTEHERYVSEEVVGGPVFLTDYPKEIKAFYMRQNEDGKTVAAMDLLVPGVGEIIGGSQREERYDVLKTRMEELKMELSEYDWYLDLRRYGSIPHAGFGLGLERAVMYLSGMQNIRDVIPFPRTPRNAEF